MTAVQAGDVIGEYKVIRPLGRGAFSETFEACDRRTEALVVLKFPDPALLGDPTTFERFQRELAIGKQLIHPNIARAMGIEQSDEGPYLVLEYVEGTPFRTYLDDHAPLPVAEAVAVAAQIADALAYAHSHGVFHRDLKPENLIISSDHSVHIVDFGIALLEGARRMTWRFVSERMGTPDYMSPEQIQGKRGDARTDIYALGIMFYEMLTGGVPFTGDNSLAVMSQHVSAPPVSPRRLNPAVPPALEWITLKAIRKDPEERYQHAAELLRDLQHYDELDPNQFVFGPETMATYSEARSMLVGTALGVGIIVLGALAVVVGYLIHQR